MSSSNESPFPRASDFQAEGGDASAQGRASDMMDKVVQGAHKAVDRLAERATPAVERLERKFDDAASRAQSEAERITSLQDEWIVKTRDCVREHPITSVGVAVLAGMLLNKILGGR